MTSEDITEKMSLEALSPPKTRLNRKNHLLYSENFGQTPNTVILGTGYPEGPNQLALSTGTDLRFLFNRTNEKTAVAQVYIGKNPLEIKKMSANLRHALEKAGSSDVSLAVFSAGALALCDLPQEYHHKIVSLVIISPFIGIESAKTTLPSFLKSFFGKLLKNVGRLPRANKYLDSVDPLINSLFKRGRPVSVFLGQKDPFVDSGAVEKLIKGRFPHVTVVTNDRGHVPLPEELNTAFKPFNASRIS